MCETLISFFIQIKYIKWTDLAVWNTCNAVFQLSNYNLTGLSAIKTLKINNSSFRQIFFTELKTPERHLTDMTKKRIRTPFLNNTLFYYFNSLNRLDA